MREIEILDLRIDNKVKAKCLLAKITIRKYLELIKENLENLEYQRGKILTKKSNVYKRLIEDLKEGAIIPPLS